MASSSHAVEDPQPYFLFCRKGSPAQLYIHSTRKLAGNELHSDSTCKLAGDGLLEETSPRAVSAPKRTKLAAQSFNGTQRWSRSLSASSGTSSGTERESEGTGVRVMRKLADDTRRDDGIKALRLKSLGTRCGTPSRRALQAVPVLTPTPTSAPAYISAPSPTSAPTPVAAPTAISAPKPTPAPTPPTSAPTASSAPTPIAAVANISASTPTSAPTSASASSAATAAPAQGCTAGTSPVDHSRTTTAAVEGASASAEGSTASRHTAGVPVRFHMVLALECACAHCHGKSLSARVESLLSCDQASFQPPSSPHGSPKSVPNSKEREGGREGGPQTPERPRKMSRQGSIGARLKTELQGAVSVV